MAHWQRFADRQDAGRLLARRLAHYRSRSDVLVGSRAYPDVRGRTVILVDDGLATGASMRAAAEALRQLQAGRIVVAVPVGSPDTCRELEDIVDETICAYAPEPFYSVGQFYEDFGQTTDEDVRQILERTSERAAAAKG